MQNVELAMPVLTEDHTEDDDDGAMDTSEATGDNSTLSNGTKDDCAQDPKDSVLKGDVSLSFERFATIQKAIGRYIREKEEQALSAKLARRTVRAQILASGGAGAAEQAGDKDDDDDDEDEGAGVVQGQIVTWYLSSQDITSEAQLSREKRLICSVIDKLIHDKILTVMDDDDDEEEEDEHDEEEEEEDEDYESAKGDSSKTKKSKQTRKLEREDARKQERYLSVHPNYAFE